MAHSPEVTVVIPTRNRWELLSIALRSALGQEAVDVEVIVVDDGSTDGTPDRLGALEEPRLRVVRHERSEGVARARNHGIDQARGSWIAFLDDDDLWSPRKSRAQLDVASKTGCSLVYGTAVALDAARRPLRVMRAPESSDIARKLLTTNVIRGPSTVMVRAEVLSRVGGFDEDLSAFADWDLWLRAAPVDGSAACREVVVGYVHHASNMLTSDPERLAREFHRLASKHDSTARSAGIRFGELWTIRSVAERHLRGGRPIKAAQAFLRLARASRSRAEVANAIIALGGEPAERLAREALARATPSPAWLDLYR